jgi:hypothetical protein
VSAASEEKLEQLAIVEQGVINTWAAFLRKLKTDKLLDDTMVLLTSNLGNASAHDSRRAMSRYRPAAPASSAPSRASFASLSICSFVIASLLASPVPSSRPRTPEPGLDVPRLLRSLPGLFGLRLGALRSL